MWTELLVFGIAYMIARLIFSLVRRRHHYASFVRRSIPGPKPNLLFGNWLSYRRTANKNDLIDKWLNEYGSVFGYYLGDHRFIVAKDLQLVQEAFLKNSGILRNRNPFALDSRYFKDSLIG
jgi:hypothetical protein